MKLPTAAALAALGLGSTLQEVIASVSPRIINGTDVEDMNDYPFMVSLQIPGIGHFCGGSVIGPDIVMTAAHCVIGIDLTYDDAFIRFGSVDIYDPNLSYDDWWWYDDDFVMKDDNTPESDDDDFVAEYVDYKAVEIVLHPNYSDTLIRNDIALIRFDGQLPDEVWATLDDGSRGEQDSRKELTAIGWGINESGVTPNILQRATLNYISQENCTLFFDHLHNINFLYPELVLPMTSDKLCVAGDRVNVCFGDSGGPLIENTEGTKIVVGVTSHGVSNGCSLPFEPAIFSRVSFQYPWILHTMCQISQYVESLDVCSDIFEYPSAAPSSTLEPSSVCYDLDANWVHSDLSRDCAWFGNHNERCLYFGYYPDFITGYSADEVCCTCGGGASTFPPSESPMTLIPTYSASPTSQCYDNENWRDYETGIDCEWVTEGGDDWWYDDVSMCSVLDYLIDENGVRVSEACCACGGGNIRDPSSPSGSPSKSNHPTVTSSPTFDCVDIDGWLDYYGDDCAWYEGNDLDDLFYDDKQTHCDNWGETSGTLDYTANEACCVCGGGSNYLRSLPSRSPSISHSPSTSTSPTSSCYDYPDWLLFGYITCSDLLSTDDYINNDDICSYYDEYKDEYGVSALVACCSCGGGLMRDPSKPSSLPTTFEPTLSQVPTNVPSISLQPSLSSSPTATCSDVEGWVDYYGDGCDWFADNIYDDEIYDDKNFLTKCDLYGFIEGTGGLLANDACCECGGGQGRYPTSAPTKSAVPSTSRLPTNMPLTSFTPSEQCFDIVGWVDDYGDGCDWYSYNNYYYDDIFPTNCEMYGDTLGTGGLTANEACCVCSGGHGDIPTLAPTKSVKPSNSLMPSGQCGDIDGWVDFLGDGCDWYADNPFDDDYFLTKCEMYGSDAGSGGLTANTACCVCGGGEIRGPTVADSSTPTTEPSISSEPSLSARPTAYPTSTFSPTVQCQNVDGWVDDFGDGCEWYEENLENWYDDGLDDTFELCNVWSTETYGELNATQACCVCGGGLGKFPTTSPTISHEPSVSLVPTSSCVDIFPWFSVEYPSINCEWFGHSLDDSMFWYDDNDSRCMFDYLKDADGVTASEACCSCGGGKQRDGMMPTNPPTVCIDLLWFDVINNYDCSFFDSEYDCGQYGEIAMSWTGMLASDSCCVCGGGQHV